MVCSWNLEEVAQIVIWGQENVQSVSTRVIYCTSSYRFLYGTK